MECDEPLRLNILVRGTVQRVGYRHLIQGIARKHHITGQITNLEGYDVQIIAEGRNRNLSRFKNDIIIQEHPVYVESIEVLEETYTGEYSYFNVVRGTPEDELAERLDSAIAIFSRMEKKQDFSIGLQRETLELQKETTGLQKETLGLQKETLGLQGETLDEVKGIRQDLNKTLTQEIAEVRIELREMRSALIQAGIMKSVLS
ncbi:MAG: acylphosphatase [Methanobacteriota archaeon]